MEQQHVLEGDVAMGGCHLADAAAAHLAVLVTGHIHVTAQQMVCHVVLYHQLEQQSAQPVAEHAQRSFQHLLHCMGQVCTCFICVNITVIESYCLFNEFTLAAAIVQMGIYFHHLFCRICKPKCVFSLVRCHS